MAAVRKQVHQVIRFFTAVIILLVPSVIFFSYLNFNLDALKFEEVDNVPRKAPKYLIDTLNCKIPDLDPRNEEVLPYLNQEKYTQCSERPLLTYIEKKDFITKLKINRSVIHLYSSLSIECCYSHILRQDGDTTVRHDSCVSFGQEAIITYPYIRVNCRNFLGIVYQNVHATILPKDFKDVLARKETRTKQWKIFILGIDSISNLNLQRTMPKVHKYLENNFIGFKGYNKIEDNTFPNLMAILAGRSMGTLEPICMRNETFDDCDIIWKNFRESGYVTVYGEDEPLLNTFTYFKKGFSEPPTSVYLRPYFLSAYLLPVVYKHMMGVCTGPENTAERMLNHAKEFLKTFKNSPTFAFYWLNSFSHDDVNFPTSMDDKLLEFLTDSIVNETSNDSISIVFSDHGFRFGDIRFTYSGWLEERLPFIYFKFPKSFQNSYPQFISNFKVNAQSRLTTPYDFHMTLQHIFKLSNDSYVVKPSLGCPKCNSLFELVDKARSCEDAGIPQHWCTCKGYDHVSTKLPDVIRVGQYVVEEVNKLIDGFTEEKHKCATYTLNAVETVGKTAPQFVDDVESHTYLILVKTYPYAMFEATVSNSGDDFRLLGEISRLNKYGAYSNCIHHDVLKKYCFCDSWSTKILSHICYLFNCRVY